ncbi:hypothetical protein [Pseudonocardia spinosispora]|uniref:hypothetical protein n=1 Tax=Pseudonocardia spinosispora TaxID=103441 RepID=UPI00048BD082|nr:hypothetical protein [Pseudonocardia spinosispora]
MAIRDLAGTGALQDALVTTNARLADVLSELKKTNGEALGSMNDHLLAVLRQLEETNGQRLEAVAQELRTLNGKLDRLVVALEKD